MNQPDPVGPAEIAARLEVSEHTVRKWMQRNIEFPSPTWTVGGRPAWDYQVVLKWYEKRKGCG